MKTRLLYLGLVVLRLTLTACGEIPTAPPGKQELTEGAINNVYIADPDTGSGLGVAALTPQGELAGEIAVPGL